MSYKTDSGDGGKGVPPKKPKVEGGYQRRCLKTRRENKKPAVIITERVTFSGLT